MVRRILRMGLVGAALVVLFSALMIAAYALPNARIKSHLPSSIQQLAWEGQPYRPLFGLWGISTDNYVDALMLNEALGFARSGPVHGAFANVMLTQTTWPGADTLGDLRAALANEGEPFAYPRYWHGYQVVLRPLLLFFDYRAIRWVSMVVFALLAATATVVVRYRLGLKAMFAFLVALLSVNVAIVPTSLNMEGVFFIALGGVVVAALNMDREKALALDLETFLVLGALTSFLDLFTTPLVTLGLPLAVLLVGRMESSREFSNGSQWRYTAKMSVAWGFGYAGAWLAKWLLSSLILGRNIFADALSSVLIRSYGHTPGITTGPLNDLAHNVLGLLPVLGWHKDPAQWDVVAAASLLPLVTVLAVLVLLARHRRSDGKGARVLGLLPVAMFPFAWYLVIYNHSSIHYYMTYRLLAISVFAAVFSVLYLLDPAYLAAQRARLEARLRGG